MEALKLDQTVLNTNKVLKKVVQGIDKYYKEDFIKMLSVNVEKVEPIDFTGSKYNKNEHSKAIFLFINENYRLIGILKGNEYDKKYYSNYCIEFKDSNYRDIPRNRKNLEAHSMIVLMLSESMRNFRIKGKQKVLTEKQKRERAAADLKKRLFKYKANKNHEVTFEQMQLIIKEIINKINKNLFNTDPEYIKFVQKISNGRDSLDFLRNFAGYVDRFLDAHKNYQRTVSSYGLEFADKYYKDEYESYKIFILNIKNNFGR